MQRRSGATPEQHSYCPPRSGGIVEQSLECLWQLNFGHNSTPISVDTSYSRVYQERLGINRFSTDSKQSLSHPPGFFKSTHEFDSSMLHQ
jgi:hypothetical protein